MPVTHEDVENFNRFLAEKLANGGADSMVELAAQWEASRREYAQTVAALGECIADMEAGRGRPFAEFVAEIRAKYNIPATNA
jgi:hypothetical protein